MEVDENNETRTGVDEEGTSDTREDKNDALLLREEGCEVCEEERKDKEQKGKKINKEINETGLVGYEREERKDGKGRRGRWKDKGWKGKKVMATFRSRRKENPRGNVAFTYVKPGDKNNKGKYEQKKNRDVENKTS